LRKIGEPNPDARVPIEVLRSPASSGSSGSR